MLPVIRRRHVRHKLDVIRSTGGSRQRRDREARGGRTWANRSTGAPSNIDAGHLVLCSAS
jgi:hypothetical protein